MLILINPMILTTVIGLWTGTEHFYKVHLFQSDIYIMGLPNIILKLEFRCIFDGMVNDNAGKQVHWIYHVIAFFFLVNQQSVFNKFRVQAALLCS